MTNFKEMLTLDGNSEVATTLEKWLREHGDFSVFNPVTA